MILHLLLPNDSELAKGLLISRLALTPLNILLLVDIAAEESWLIRFEGFVKKDSEDVELWEECEELELEELLEEVRDLDRRGGDLWEDS